MSEKTLTIEDLLCMLDEIEPGQGRRGYELLVATFRQGQYAKLYAQIEQMAIDAGTDRAKVGWEREAVEAHRAVDHLLGLDAEALALELAGGERVADDFNTMIQICTLRRGREESDDAKLAALEATLAASLQDFKTPGIREAQQSLDFAIEQLVSAYTATVGPRLAPTKASQHLIARAFRELRTFEKPLQQPAAG